MIERERQREMDPDIQRRKLREQLYSAATEKDEDRERKLAKISGLLTQMGGSVGMKNPETGNTILDLSILTKQPDMAATILDHPNSRHIDLNNRNNSGKTTAELAESAGYKELAARIRSQIERRKTWVERTKGLVGRLGGRSI